MRHRCLTDLTLLEKYSIFSIILTKIIINQKISKIYYILLVLNINLMLKYVDYKIMLSMFKKI